MLWISVARLGPSKFHSICTYAFVEQLFRHQVNIEMAAFIYLNHAAPPQPCHLFQ